MKTQYKILLWICFLSLAFISCEEEGIEENGFGTITGTVVTDGDNIPLENVKISTTPVSNTVFTNENGRFIIDQVPVGEYSVQAEITDFLTAFEPANVIANQEINVVFELDPSSSLNSPPSTPQLLSPEDNSTEIPVQVELVWSSSATDSDVINYIVELRNGSSNEMLVIEDIQDTTYTVENLQLGVNYFWQVTASDGINPAVESSISSFATKDPTLNRIYYVREDGDNNVIFSGTDSEGTTSNPDENEIQLTPSSKNSFRPRANKRANKIAFLQTVGANTHLFTMNFDGTETEQITSDIPVVGFRQDEIDYTWTFNGQGLIYSNLNRLYSININGTGNTLLYETAPGTFITEVDTNEINNLLAIKTNDANGYNARIVIINPTTGVEVHVIIENELGALGGIDFSIDASKVLYTRDVSGFESSNYRQLDTRMFIYDIINTTTTEIDAAKANGTNDLDAKFSPNEGAIIYVNTSNDGTSIRNIYQVLLSNQNNRELLFTDAFMPDWE